MNTTFKKLFIVVEFVLMVFGIMVVDSTLLPILIAGVLFYPAHKVACSMTEQELSGAFGINFLRKHFKNSKFVEGLADINE